MLSGLSALRALSGNPKSIKTIKVEGEGTFAVVEYLGNWTYRLSNGRCARSEYTF